MVDLDDLLLEAAGRTNAAATRRRHSHPSSSRRREGSFSDGGSDSRDDSDEDRGYPASRKPSVSQVPLKKRLEAEREARAEGGYGDGTSDREGDSSEESDFGDDLYKNEEDRQKLAGMTEFQREMILAERADKKGDKNFTEKLRSKRENEKTTTPVSKKDTQPLPASRGVRSSARSADRAAAKDDALNELRAKRMKQQDPAALKKLRDASKGGSGSRDFSSMKRKPLASSKFSSSSDSDRSQSDDEGSNGGMVDSDDDRSDVPTYEDIKEITIRRSKLAKWLMEPFFEELIVGCFVRVGIGRSKSGPIYRLCMVKNVDAADPDKAYKLENKTTHKYLNVFWGNETSAARWQMAMISDGHPVEEEYRQWIREVERTNGRLPSKQDVSEKKEAIRRINSFVYSAETVKQMLQEKKSASVRPMNVAAEKDRLGKELEIAESKNDQAGVERIKAKIKQLDASRNKKGVDKKALKLYEMNKKNRAENFKNASEVKSITASLKAGEAGYDPFSRRWTRSSNYYNGKNSGKDGGENEAAVAAAVKSNGADAEGENGVEATEAALEAAAEAGKLIDTRAPIGQGAEHNLMHNFELPLSLAALQKYGGPQGVQKAFMARKQMTEATVGCRVVVNDGKRHGLTLTVSDYKRRRGLL
ncbi:PREDICTED: protein RTF1 homolog [Brassica oleracea var. oleracea]|uniref:Plus3 domain-containing protein n=1 Tax=Brassica oleracea var. oleracea TaxID=109376 RepID=A0A0D3BVB3_BRAOL|nr:PREDICTED: protein RTF1 homolog [Brassica oleracea var. oleracea]